MDVWIDLIGFVLKTITVLLAITVIIVLNARQRRHSKSAQPFEGFSLTPYHEDREAICDQFNQILMDKKTYKTFKKKIKSEKKQNQNPRPKLFIIDFKGDMRCSGVGVLRHQITALLSVAHQGDQVLLKLASSGGTVTGYGLAASQLDRLRQHGIRLVVSIDQIAASGGYMMACVAHEIIAAPFAVIGSIGVLTQYPNLSKLLKRFDIEFNELTAGEHKNSHTIFGDNEPKKLQKVQEDINVIHQLFKQQIAQYRPAVAIDQIATGEIWPATIAKHLNLIDGVQTTEEYIHEATEYQIYTLNHEKKTTRFNRLVHRATQALIQPFLHKHGF